MTTQEAFVSIAQTIIRARFGDQPTDNNVGDTMLVVRRLLPCTFDEMLAVRLELLRRYQID